MEKYKVSGIREKNKNKNEQRGIDTMTCSYRKHKVIRSQSVKLKFILSGWD